MLFSHTVPVKRCDICLYRRAVLKVDKNKAIKAIGDIITAVERKRDKALLRKRQKEADAHNEIIRVWREKIKEVSRRGYAELCSICGEEPRVLLISVKNKESDVPDELCLDCPVCWEYECKLFEAPKSEKEASRRGRLIDKYGRLKLC